jgi:hypothetical protein
MADTWLNIWTGIWDTYWGSPGPGDGGGTDPGGEVAAPDNSTYYNVQVEIYKDNAPFSLVDIIHARVEPTTLAEIRAHGAGSFKVSKHDPKILQNPSLIKYRNYVRIRLNGQVIGGFVLFTRKSVIVGAGEEADEMWELSGEGPRSWVRDAIVYPPRGLKTKSADTRYFNFATEQGSWYKPNEWQPASQIAKWNSGYHWWGTAPANWPDSPNSYWIWNQTSTPSSQGFVYFRYEHNFALKASYSLFFAVDDQAEVYVDGELLMTTAEHAWEDTSRLDFDLDAGWHVIGVKAYNYRSDGPGSLIGALFRVGDASTPSSAELIAVTDSSWLVNGYPVEEPGWTAGDVLVTLMNEAKARNVRFANNFTLTFTATHDSAGEPWTNPVPWSFGTGSTYEDVIDAIEELGTDIYVDPNSLDMFAWKKRGVNRSLEGTSSSPIILTPGHNLLSADETGQAEIVNTLILHSSEGWTEQAANPEESTSITEYGRIESQLATGLSTSGAKPLVDELFRQKALPEKSATFEIVPVTGMVPFQDFNVGDYISAPGEIPGYMESRRVMSIAFTEDSDTGRPIFALEFDTIFKDRQATLEKWISRVSGTSAIGGGFANSGNLPPTTINQPPGQPLGSVPDAPTGLVASSVGKWTEAGTESADYGLTWNPVITGTGYGTMQIESYEVWGRLLPNTESTLLAVVFDSMAYLSGFRPRDEWAFKVRAVSRTGGPGPFGAEVGLIAAAPATPLLAPSAPVLSSKLGAVSVRWDGLLGGSPAPGYMRRVRVDRIRNGFSEGMWTEKRRNYFTNPEARGLTSFSTSSAYSMSTVLDMPGNVQTGVRVTRNSTASTTMLNMVLGTVLTPNTAFRFRFRVRASIPLEGISFSLRPNVSSATGSVLAATADLPVGDSYVDFVGTTGATAPSSTAGLTLIKSVVPNGATLDVTEVLVEKVNVTTGGYFSGATTSPTDPNMRYRWLGTPQASASVEESTDSWVTVGLVNSGQLLDSTVIVGATYDYRLVALDPYDVPSLPSPTNSITVTGIATNDITGALPSNNLVFNGSFEDELNGWQVAQRYSAGTSATIVTSALAGSKSLRLQRGVEPEGLEVEFVVAQTPERYIPIGPQGVQSGYYVSARANSDVAVTSGFSLYAYYYLSDKTTSASKSYDVIVSAKNLNVTPALFAGKVVPPTDAKFMRIGVAASTPNKIVNVDDVVVREVITNDMIGQEAVTGVNISGASITGNHIQGETIEGQHVKARTFTGDKFVAGSITTNELAADIGQNLDISSNTSVNILIQQDTALQNSLDSTNANVAGLQTYYNFTAEGAIIGKSDSAFKLFLKNDRIEILQNGVIVSYWEAQRMVVPSFVGQEVVLAKHKLEQYGNGTVVKAV